MAGVEVPVEGPFLKGLSVGQIAQREAGVLRGQLYPHPSIDEARQLVEELVIPKIEEDFDYEDEIEISAPGDGIVDIRSQLAALSGRRIGRGRDSHRAVTHLNPETKWNRLQEARRRSARLSVLLGREMPSLIENGFNFELDGNGNHMGDNDMDFPREYLVPMQLATKPHVIIAS